jgi:hypothetical protein
VVRDGLRASGDRPLKRLREPSRWTAVVRSCPRHAHWLDGEPMTPVMPMGGVVDRYRRFTGNGAGRAAGVVSVADAWACTNPSLGRGIALGLVHAALLRRAVREHGEDPARLVDGWDEATERELTPWYRATLAFDRARLAEIKAIREGAEPPAPAPDDVAAQVRAALPAAMARDPEGVPRGARDLELPGAAAGGLRPAGPGAAGAGGGRRRGRDAAGAEPRAGARARRLSDGRRRYSNTCDLTPSPRRTFSIASPKSSSGKSWVSIAFTSIAPAAIRSSAGPNELSTAIEPSTVISSL